MLKRIDAPEFEIENEYFTDIFPAPKPREIGQGTTAGLDHPFDQEIETLPVVRLQRQTPQDAAALMLRSYQAHGVYL